MGNYGTKMSVDTVEFVGNAFSDLFGKVDQAVKSKSKQKKKESKKEEWL